MGITISLAMKAQSTVPKQFLHRQLINETIVVKTTVLCCSPRCDRSSGAPIESTHKIRNIERQLQAMEIGSNHERRSEVPSIRCRAMQPLIPLKLLLLRPAYKSRNAP